MRDEARVVARGIDGVEIDRGRRHFQFELSGLGLADEIRAAFDLDPALGQSGHVQLSLQWRRSQQPDRERVRCETGDEASKVPTVR